MTVSATDARIIRACHDVQVVLVDFCAYLLFLTAISLWLTLCTSFNTVVCFGSDVSLAICNKSDVSVGFIQKSCTNFIDVQVSAIYQ